MIFYKISYDELHDGVAQSVDVIVRAAGYADEGDTLTLFDKLPTGEFIHVASFKKWNSITDTLAMQE